MINLKIKITGSGTSEEIVNSLKSVIKDIENPDVELDRPNNWEDKTLMTEVSPE